MRLVFAAVFALALLGVGARVAQAQPSPTTLFCGRWAGDEPFEQIKPKQCSTIGPTDSLADGLVLKRLRWRNWGASTQSGRHRIGFRSSRRTAVGVLPAFRCHRLSTLIRPMSPAATQVHRKAKTCEKSRGFPPNRKTDRA